jgi:hypothetical protein
MNAMEQMALTMLQKMTGLSADEMKTMANNAIQLLVSLDSRLNRIEANIHEIKMHLNMPVEVEVITIEGSCDAES